MTKILLVEDNEMNRDMLERGGYQVGIDVTSTDAEGTTFTVHLPRCGYQRQKIGLTRS